MDDISKCNMTHVIMDLPTKYYLLISNFVNFQSTEDWEGRSKGRDSF